MKHASLVQMTRRSPNLHIRTIGHLRKYLINIATSGEPCIHVHYIKAGCQTLPSKLLKMLQNIANAVARIMINTPRRHDHITPVSWCHFTGSTSDLESTKFTQFFLFFSPKCTIASYTMLAIYVMPNLFISRQIQWSYIILSYHLQGTLCMCAPGIHQGPTFGIIVHWMYRNYFKTF